MKYLVVARHGHASCDELTEKGKGQVTELANELKRILKGGSTRILSSPDTRAVQSAKILADTLDVRPEIQATLSSCYAGHPDTPNQVIALIDGPMEVDALILVTHLENTGELPKRFAQEKLGVELHPEEIRHGKAWIIDCEAKTISLA